MVHLKKALSSIHDPILYDILKEAADVCFLVEGYVDQYIGELEPKFASRFEFPKYVAEIIDYMKKTGQDKFQFSDEFIQYLVSLGYNSNNPMFQKYYLDSYRDLDGFTAPELEEAGNESIVVTKDEVDSAVANELEKYNRVMSILQHKYNGDDLVTSLSKPNIPSIIKDILTNTRYDEDEEDGVVVYVHSSEDDEYSSTGLSVNPETGRISIFEENDESGPATDAIVSTLTGDPNKKYLVYSAHNENVCQQIYDTLQVPKDLFFSPSLKYAQGYLQQGRDIISFKIEHRYVKKTSQYDWKSNSDAPVSDVKFV